MILLITYMVNIKTHINYYRYAEQCIASDNPGPRSRSHKWYNTDNSEMRAFLGMLLMMGLVKKPTIASYWETTNALTDTPGFRKIMPRDR